MRQALRVTDDTPAASRRPGGNERTGPPGRNTAVVVVASSTGGPAALGEFLPGLPADLDAAVVCVQHLPVGFARSLAQRLDRRSLFAVREAEEGDSLLRGLALLAPGGRHLEGDGRGLVRFSDGPPVWGVRPAADVTMRSFAALYGPRVVGVILTGMGRDGAQGAQAIAEAGGVCFAQDAATSVVYGMPRAAFEAGAVSARVPLSEMADAVARHVRALNRLPAG